MSSSHTTARITRRQLVIGSAAALVASRLELPAKAVSGRSSFALRYILGSCLYGYDDVRKIAAEVRKAGAEALDIWPKVHGNQREQLDEMGSEAFAELLQQNKIELGCLSQYKLGPFGLRDEMRLADRLGCHLIVTGAKGPKGLQGAELKSAVSRFVEQMKPHLAVARQTHVTIAIENHGNSLIESPDSMKWLAELAPPDCLGLAFAPYHLPQDPRLLSDLIRKLGNRIKMFYAWQHGMGCMKKLPKQQELLQLPGRGPLDFRPLLAALKAVRYTGYTEIFMHPVPRGVPILKPRSAVTAEINRARRYLEKCLAAV